MDRKSSESGRDSKGGHSAEQNESVREGFGDDMGTRVGRPDPGATDDRSMARLSENADDRGIEGAVLAGSDNPGGSPGGTERGSRPSSSGGERSRTRADGSSMDGEGQTLDHAQRAQSGTPQRGAASGGGAAETGMGGEANRGVDGAKVERGSDEQGSERAGSEPLRGRQSEHKPSYGGEGGEPRTSSDQRERGVDYYGDEGTGKSH